jgi:hypothetical protein
MNNTMETRMMKLMKGLMWSMGIIFAIIMTLAVGRAFYCSFLEDGAPPPAPDYLEKARVCVHRAESEEDPFTRQKLWMDALWTLYSVDEEQRPAALELAKNMIPGMQEFISRNQLPKIQPESRLSFMLSHAGEDLSCLDAHIRSGVYDFSAQSSRDNRHALACLLRDILGILNKERYGARVEQLKPIVLTLLQQGVRTNWPDIILEHELIEYDPEVDDPVLTAVRTRDAEFLRAVLACGLPARGTHGDNKPEKEAEWQNSPDLVEILQSN